MIEQTALTHLICRALYTLKREYGGTISVYRLNDVAVNRRTGVKTVDRDVFVVDRAVVLPVTVTREVIQSISQISADKKFVMGGQFVQGKRTFIVEVRDLPDGFALKDDDWVVYRDKRYDLESIQEFENRAGWIVVGTELPDRRPEQIFPLSADSLFRPSSSAGATP
jgi:hypothetical protein